MTQLNETRKKDIFDNPSLRCALNAFAENIVDKISLTPAAKTNGEAEMGVYIATNINESNVCLFVCSIYFHVYIVNKYLINTECGDLAG